ncbi:acyltransferase family protein [Xanthobacter sediminis]|uniref:acyltransferase family protein n=1 Tax=Xanthobacter sediminis TaxID=3119926 RepID=UPI00372BF259
MSLAYRPDIDGLRAVAVGSVVLFHGGFSLFSGGFVGVDVFFVISGFLITSILAEDLEKGRFSLVEFYDRRIRRILPALFLVLAATTLLGTFILLPNQMEDLARSLIPATLFYANVHFMGLESYFAPAVEEMPLLHLWSLAVEEQFYIVFPLVLFVFMRLGGKRLAVGGLLLLALGSLVFSQMELSEAPRRAFFLLSSRAWELLAGALLALAPLPRVGPRIAAGLGAVGLAALLAPVFFYDRHTTFPGIAALPPVLGAVLLIYSGRHAAKAPVARLLSLPAMVYVGRISYSLYLWHWPLLALVFVYRGRAPTPLLAMAVIAVSVALSALSLRYVETPLRRREVLGGRRIARFAAAAAVMLLAVGGAWGIEMRDGRLWPLSPRGLKAEAVIREVQTLPACDSPDAFMRGTTTCTVTPPGAGKEVDVVVWGDSHARAAFRGLSEMFAERGLSTRLLTLSGCPPLVGVSAPIVGDSSVECAAFNTAVMAEIDKTRPKLVVLVSRWSLWTTHARANFALTMPDLPAARVPSPEGSRAAFPIALRRTLDDIRKAGAKALVLGQAPEYLHAPAGCVVRAEYFGRDASGCTTQPLKSAERILNPADTVISEVVSEVPGTGAVRLSQVFCDAKECRAGEGDAFYYSDTNHLSLAGSRQLRDAKVIGAIVAELLGLPAQPVRAEAEHAAGRTPPASY